MLAFEKGSQLIMSNVEFGLGKHFLDPNLLIPENEFVV